jgi:hypothetical protein
MLENKFQIQVQRTLCLLLRSKLLYGGTCHQAPLEPHSRDRNWTAFTSLLHTDGGLQEDNPACYQ